MYMRVLAACLCTTDMQFPQMPEESIGSSGVGIADRCELPAVSTGNQTQVLR